MTVRVYKVGILSASATIIRLRRRSQLERPIPRLGPSSCV